jgi:SAM-dependent methyltransferase
LKQLNSSITTDPKNLDTGFDLIYALLAFHHLKTPETMLNQVLKDNYLNPGGRILIMDYERDPMKQIFHPIHLINGEHYEHDGFTEKIVRDWFEKGK